MALPYTSHVETRSGSDACCSAWESTPPPSVG
uniref:Uncharacterized protein n=1 Tax=Arundo donax TaxID=35708 RepID=A0A0A9BBK5_ARUDO